MNIIVILKGAERYIFVFDDEHERQFFRTICGMACNRDLSLTWRDVAVAYRKMVAGQLTRAGTE